ncbi:ATP/GTP-binding protein [Marinitenerispora sediminis]|uniref:ATP/GTP-binding protein n=1 Tax=Marinitenerispora sediminis TaxID=1931232 RepID=UPI0015F155B2|nr:ATP/GTP-binding protein [Marinitenerispora sediminis]
MSPRRNVPRRKAAQRPESAEESLILRVTGAEHRETGPDGEWVLRRITGAAAAKVYRCPGCQQDIPPGMAHVVAWRPYGDGEDRRHWHSSCWQRRTHRSARPPRR